MNKYRKILKRVGIVLVIVGVLDLAYMAYCIANNQSYSSSLNIFSVIAGIFLVRGSLQTAKIVTWVSAFMLTGALGATLLILPFMKPLGLWAVEFRLNPISTGLLVLILPVAIVLSSWVYKQLRSPAVMQARASVGQIVTPPRSAFVLGIFLSVGSAAVLYFMINGDSGAKAAQLAQAQLGAAYKYQVTAIHWSGGHYRASVTAYRDNEIKSVDVEW
jgi:hypothetical protein